MERLKADKWWDSENFSAIDRRMSAINRYFIVDHPFRTLFFPLAVYVLVVLGTGTYLGISANYFVILPVLIVSLVCGFPGGLIAGVCALPANLFLFWLLGHAEYSPASKIIAELSGVFVGSAFGFLSDYFRKMIREMEKRKEAERELRRSLGEKEILLRELQHRVKNNLNLIKGLIQLQRNRSSDPAFREASGLLLNRVFSIAAAHDLLFDGPNASNGGEPELVGIRAYLLSIVSNISEIYPQPPIQVSVDVDPPEFRMEAKSALNLGLIVNELAVNAAKHAFEHVDSPRLDIYFQASEAEFTLIVQDNGSGCVSGAPDLHKGLGLTLIDAIAKRVEGRTTWLSSNGFRFELVFPRSAM